MAERAMLQVVPDLESSTLTHEIEDCVEKERSTTKAGESDFERILRQLAVSTVKNPS